MTRPLSLFAGIGIELEYMIVSRRTLAVRPISDRVLFEVAGAFESEVEMGELAWSNELVLHVIELKTNGPRPSLHGLSELFARDVGKINEILRSEDGCLMPSGMHPWMDPTSETHLWPHEYNRVYQEFDRIFGCRGHGWSNLQSMHINLPFSGDEEFGRLHAAIRMILPIVPALAASSPFAGGAPTGFLDTRLDFYRRNCARVPAVAGYVIPERVFSEDDYRRKLLEPLYAAIRPLDSEGVLEHEWLNARGAIARFDRNAIEIRLADVQECPRADMAVAAAVVGLVRALVEERWVSWADQRRWDERRLAAILDATIRDAGEGTISDTAYLRDMGMDPPVPSTAGELLEKLIGKIGDSPELAGHQEALGVLTLEGTLARRMLRASARGTLADIGRELCRCLAENRMFVAHA